MAGAEAPARNRVPIREGFFTAPLTNFEDVHLKGTRCQSCGEVFLGKRWACESCQGRHMEEVILSDRGVLYTYTIIRYRPPGAYKGPDPFVPFAAGLVELPEGLRIMTRITDCPLEQLVVGMPVQLVVAPFRLDEEGNEIIAFSFKPL